MVTQFLTLEIPLPDLTGARGLEALQIAIATGLQQQGDPLRWAITSVDKTRRIAVVEAIVTCNNLSNSGNHRDSHAG